MQSSAPYRPTSSFYCETQVSVFAVGSDAVSPVLKIEDVAVFEDGVRSAVRKVDSMYQIKLSHNYS